MGYKIFVKSKVDGSLEEIDDEVYADKDEAKDALSEAKINFATGAEVLELSGEDFDSPEDYDFIIKKV